MKKNILYSLLTLTVLGITGCESLDSTQFDQNSVGNNDGKLDSKYVLFPTLKLENGQSADVVIGQPDMVSNGVALGDRGEATPYGNVTVYNGRLFLQDFGLNRILVYNSIPNISGQPADYVIGQDDFTSAGSGNSDSDLNGPLGTSIDASEYASKYNTRLVVAEFWNNRVTIYNSIPTSSGASSDIVVGQADFNQNISGCSATNMFNPLDVLTVDGKLIIADTSNNRVLIYNSIPTKNGAAADIVLGQNSLNNGCPSNNGRSGLQSPSGIWSDGKRLVVVDSDNNRVLIWNSFPTTNAAPADVVIGQPDFFNTAVRPTSARDFNNPWFGVFSNGRQLFVSDSNNHRILVWNSFPTQNYQEADIVLGQVDFVSSGPGLSADTFNYPYGVYQYKNNLIVSDVNNNRHLIFHGK